MRLSRSDPLPLLCIIAGGVLRAGASGALFRSSLADSPSQPDPVVVAAVPTSESGWVRSTSTLSAALLEAIAQVDQLHRQQMEVTFSARNLSTESGAYRT